jgi:hypothetical protein
MAVALSILGVVFAALCVYILSYGPWLRYYAWGSHEYASLDARGFYRPLMWLTGNGPKWIADPYNAYLKWVINAGVL